MNVVYIGHEIKAELRRQGKTVSWLSDQLGMDRSNVYRILRAPSCDTILLLRLSHILHTDFFRLFSECIKIDTCVNFDTDL